MTAHTLTAMQQPQPSLASPATPASPPLADHLAQRLAAALPAWLQTEPLHGPASHQAACAYLAETSALVAGMRSSMAAQQGYALAPGGGFSLVQHLWHLADVEQFGWATRFIRLLSEPRPVLPGVDGDQLAKDRRYQQRPWRAAAQRFISQRRCTLAALARCDAAVLQRPVLFSGQAATGADMLAALLAHDHEHRTEMAGLWPPAAST